MLTHLKRITLKSSLAGLVLSGTITYSSADQQKPNILFIAIDDLKPELGCYGVPMGKTPNIDAIAKSGVTFLNSHCNQAICGPSRVSLLSGLRPDRTKVHDLKTQMRDVLPNIITIPQHFKSKGYSTFGVG